MNIIIVLSRFFFFKKWKMKFFQVFYTEKRKKKSVLFLRNYNDVREVKTKANSTCNKKKAFKKKK